MLYSDSEYQPAQAENYANYLVPAIQEIWLTDVVQMAKPRPGDAILDVACATGTVTFRLARIVGETGKVVGVEVDPALLSIAQKIKWALSVQNVSLREAEYTRLPYPALVFDRLVCTQELALYPDKEKALREMYRVLSHTGRLVLMSTGSRKGNPAETILAEAFRLYMGIEPSFFTKLFSLGELAGMELLLLDGGMRSNSIVERVTHIANFTTFDGFWQGMVLGRPISQVYNELSAQTQDLIRSDVFARMAPFRDHGSEGYTMPMEVVIATVLKP